MIRPLRQLHRRAFLALGFFLPVAFAVGIVARKPLPEVNSLPKEIAPATASFANSEVWSRSDLFPKSPVQIRLLREQNGTGKFAVSFSAAKVFVKPDLLVYWSDENSSSTDTLPEMRFCWARSTRLIFHCRFCPPKPQCKPACWCFTVSPTTKLWTCQNQFSSTV